MTAVTGTSGIRLRLYGELERATRSSPVANKLDKYAGHFLRTLEEDRRCEIGAIMVAHHDPRRDHRVREKKVGAGAFNLSIRLTEDLYGSGQRQQFAALQARLQSIHPSLDIGRIILVADWVDLRACGIGTYGYTLAPYPDGNGGEIYDVTLETVAREYERLTEIVRTYVYAQNRRRH